MSDRGGDGDGPAEGLVLLAEIATDVGRLVKLVADGDGPAEHEALFAAIDPLDTDDVKAYLYAAVLAIATLRDTPPSPPLVWRRLADEWPEGWGGQVAVWRPGWRKTVVVDVQVGMLASSYFVIKPEHASDWQWAPFAAVPTPPAPEGETTE